jgi:hypothetical protein
VSAGLSAAALIPIAGDSLKAIKKYEKFIDDAALIPSRAAFRAEMTDVGTTLAAKIDSLRRLAPNAVNRLTDAGVPNGTIVSLAAKAVSAKHFDDMMEATCRSPTSSWASRSSTVTFDSRDVPEVS